MQFVDMMEIAKCIMKKNPDYYLCGSLALIWAKRIKPREVNDIDFIVNINKFNPYRMHVDEDYVIENDGYTCYKTSGDKDGFYYNVFVHDDSSKIKAKLINGIKCQDTDQILHYKKVYGRAKDNYDLRNLLQ